VRLTIREADYVLDGSSLRAIRFAVFVDEQNVPAEIELDDRDPRCIHLLALADEKAVGTARIDIEQGGKVGRLAVLSSYRRRGVGRALMERCHEIAARRGLDAVWCHAQATAVPFYERLDYRVVDAPFEEAGIVHRRMIRRF